jgi:hypothetical protein
MSVRLLVVKFWFCYQMLSTSTDCQPLIWMNYEKMIKLLLAGLVFWPGQLLVVFRFPENFSSMLV